jgi:hypothetical protein
MVERKINADKRLEEAIRVHFQKYIKEYDQLPENVKKDYGLLEYKHKASDGKMKRIIARSLLGDYLSLKATQSNNKLQRVLAAFVIASSISAVIQVLNALGWVH